MESDRVIGDRLFWVRLHFGIIIFYLNPEKKKLFIFYASFGLQPITPITLLTISISIIFTIF